MTELLDAYYAEMDAIEAGYAEARAEAKTPLEHQLADIDRAFAQSAAKIRYDAAVEYERSLAAAMTDAEKARDDEKSRLVEAAYYRRAENAAPGDLSTWGACTPESMSPERLASIRASQAESQARYDRFCAKRAAEEAEAGLNEYSCDKPRVVDGIRAAREAGFVA